MSAGHAQLVLRHLCRVVRAEAEIGDGELLDAFLNERDEAAFAALLRRHGPMVWGVCRRLTSQRPDAEDAFQAVFLVLVRKGSAVWPRERAGAWLHGVAFRVARKARRLAERRRAREKQVPEIPQRAVSDSVPDTDLCRVIDEELRRLPERLRLPVLLCDVEGRPQREAARALQMPVGTLGHRLATARNILARRLTRRGVTLSLAGLAAAAVPSSLSAVTRRAALALLNGRELASLVPPQIVMLIEGALIMTPSKFRLAAALTFVFLLGGLGLHALQRPAAIAGEQPPAKAPPAVAKAPAEPPVDDRTFLRRLSLDLRNMEPTLVEMNYFVADKDPAKRRKVAGWMLEKADGWKKDVNTTSDQRLRAYYDTLRAADQSRLKNYEDEFRRQLIGEFPKTWQLPTEEPGKPGTQASTTAELLKLALAQVQTRPAKPEEAEEMKRLKLAIDQAVEFLNKAQNQPKSVSADELKALGLKLGYGTAEALFERLAREARAQTAPGDKAADPDVSHRHLLEQWIQGLDKQSGTDAEFLRRLSLDVRGILPTVVEMRYFTEDKDPKKRQKVAEWLGGDPETRRQMHDLWQKVARASTAVPGRSADRFDKLIDELLATRRSDEQVLEALTLATMARLPTESERLFGTAFLKSSNDRPAAWRQVVGTLTATQEFRVHAAALQGRAK